MSIGLCCWVSSTMASSTCLDTTVLSSSMKRLTKALRLSRSIRFCIGISSIVEQVSKLQVLKPVSKLGLSAFYLQFLLAVFWPYILLCLLLILMLLLCCCLFIGREKGKDRGKDGLWASTIRSSGVRPPSSLTRRSSRSRSSSSASHRSYSRPLLSKKSGTLRTIWAKSKSHRSALSTSRRSSSSYSSA